MLFHRRLHLVLNGVLSHKVISHLIIWCCFLSVSSWRLWVPQSAVRRPDVVWFLPWLPLKFMRRTVLPEKESQTWRSRAGWTASDWARSRGARTGDGSPCWTRPRSSSGPATWRAKASSPAQIWGLENKFCVCVVEMCVRLKWDGVVTSKSPVCKLSELWTVQVYQDFDGEILKLQLRIIFLKICGKTYQSGVFWAQSTVLKVPLMAEQQF